MRLRSGRTISMTSHTTQNQTSPVQNVTSFETRVTPPMTGAETVTTTIGVATPAVSEAVILTTGPEVMIFPPPFTTFSQQVVNTPTSPMFGTQASTSTRPPPASQIPFPPFLREYTLGIPSSLMAGINTQSSVYADNAVDVHSPFNPYLGSGSTINSNIRQNPPQIGLGFNQQSFLPPITNNSIQVLR